MASVSFEKDIKPTLARSLYRDAMAWRLDLASYQDVKLNAAIIYGQITQARCRPRPTTRSRRNSRTSSRRGWTAGCCRERRSMRRSAFQVAMNTDTPLATMPLVVSGIMIV